MRIVLTIQEVMERGLLVEVCEMHGLNEWALAAGRIDHSFEVSLSEQEAQRLGLIPVEVE